MSQTPERPRSHRGVHAEASQSEEKQNESDNLFVGESAPQGCTPFTNKWICQDWLILLIVGLMKRRLIECECEPERVSKERAALSEKETLVALTARRERDVQKETEGNRHERSWQPAISFGVKQRACWEPQWHVDSTLSTRTKHKSVSSHNTLICLSKQIHQLIIYQFSDSEATGAARL